MIDYSYLVDAMTTEDKGDTLQQLGRHVQEALELEDAIRQKEAELADLKKAYGMLTGETIPQLLLSTGVSELKSAQGYKVKVIPDVSVTVANYAEFGEWLAARGDAGIMKTTFELGKLDSDTQREAWSLLSDKLGLYPDVKQVVHPQTLKRYIKDVCQVGEEHPTYGDGIHMPVDELPECLKTYTYYKTQIKK